MSRIKNLSFNNSTAIDQVIFNNSNWWDSVDIVEDGKGSIIWTAPAITVFNEDTEVYNSIDNLTIDAAGAEGAYYHSEFTLYPNIAGRVIPENTTAIEIGYTLALVLFDPTSGQPTGVINVGQDYLTVNYNNSYVTADTFYGSDYNTYFGNGNVTMKVISSGQGVGLRFEGLIAPISNDSHGGTVGVAINKIKFIDNN